MPFHSKKNIENALVAITTGSICGDVSVPQSSQLKYCEYCGSAAYMHMLRCESCGAPFTKNAKVKEERKLPDMRDWDLTLEKLAKMTPKQLEKYIIDNNL